MPGTSTLKKQSIRIIVKTKLVNKVNKILKIYLEDEELYNKLPELNIVFNPEHIIFKVPDEIKSKVNVIGKILEEAEYNNLLRESGLCVCLSFAEGFGHAVNEAMSAGCNLLLSPIRPFTEDLVGQKQLGTYYASYSSSS